MNAVSSFKPPDLCTAAVQVNQNAAYTSWQDAFDKIILVTETETACSFDGAKTYYYRTSHERPTIHELAKIAAQESGWTAILNADIFILPKLPQLERMLFKMGGACGVSRRWDPVEGRIIDGGLDFFCALPHVWETVAERIPKSFTIGRIVWDTWLLNYLSVMYAGVFYDLSKWAFVYHPKHEGREDQNWDYPKDDPFLQVQHWPKFVLPV